MFGFANNEKLSRAELQSAWLPTISIVFEISFIKYSEFGQINKSNTINRAQITILKRFFTSKTTIIFEGKIIEISVFVIIKSDGFRDKNVTKIDNKTIK